jgi:hypothetical protein
MKAVFFDLDFNSYYAFLFKFHILRCETFFILKFLTPKERMNKRNSSFDLNDKIQIPYKPLCRLYKL